jgi:hypothetical protein
MSDVPAYYAQPGPLTTLPSTPAIDTLLAGLPASIPDVVRAVQGNLLHIFWTERYGVQLSDERRAEVQIRPAAEMLDRIYAVDPSPLTVTRPVERRLVGNCRDFSTLTVALLRHMGIPARARCGFGVYFLPDHYEDHWVVEYWHADQARWVMLDAQLDRFQQDAMNISFDTLDMPPGQFITGGRAWQMCRHEGADPDTFGIFDMHGLWFIVGNMVRDIAALNKVELLPWDSWGLLTAEGDDFSDEMLAYLDRVAALTLAGNDSFAELRAFYDTEDRVRVPPVIVSFVGGPEPVKIDLSALLSADAS